MPVELQVAQALQPAPEIPDTLFPQALAAITAAVGDERLSGEVCVRLCAADESRQLNRDFRGKDKPTNVLSFAAEMALPDEAVPLGDLAICWPVVVAEAEAQNKAVLEHLTHLFVHGVLHLLGFDHEQEAAATEMESFEVDILAALNIRDPYAVN
jgi:probable rRNA maturation factor